MIESIYKKYGIDPNRIPTDAEVELVARCFDISESEARSILSFRKVRVGHALTTKHKRRMQNESIDVSIHIGLVGNQAIV